MTSDLLTLLCTSFYLHRTMQLYMSLLNALAVALETGGRESPAIATWQIVHGLASGGGELGI